LGFGRALRGKRGLCLGVIRGAFPITAIDFRIGNQFAFFEIKVIAFYAILGIGPSRQRFVLKGVLT
jgi:hypothetical protein